jgi:hypothetical protein
MLTAKAKYGLKALAHLSMLAPGETTQAIEIAETNNIPKKFLDASSRIFETPELFSARRGRAAVIGLPAPRPTSKSAMSSAPLMGHWRHSPMQAARPIGPAPSASM